jgi:hypothetical protein
MALDPRVRYLCKTEANGNRIIFQWTPTLAVKPLMRPVSFEEAEQIQEEESKARAAKRDKALGIQVLPDNSPVVEAVVETKLSAEDEAKINQVKKLVVTNDDLLTKEMAKLENMEDTDDIEQYFLVKYRMELEPSDDIAKMKKSAAYALSQLANQSKLYEAGK